MSIGITAEAEERAHDLPPLWDGRVVIWQGWEYAPPNSATMFHNKRDVCEGCGMLTTERGFPCWSTTWGVRADSDRLTLADFTAEEQARERLPHQVRHKAPRHWWRDLIAFRCHHCRLDTIWDTATDEMWTLDASDYSDEGSSA